MFQLKRNHDKDRRAGHEGESGTRDPPIVSPRTVELTVEQIKLWEEKVNLMRLMAGSKGQTSQVKAGQKRKADEMEDMAGEEEVIEPGMKIPKSALDSCGQSFIAADGNWVKASTKFFDDTGVMALLCQHDRPLFTVSMWTAGERQFYAYALLDSLMKELLDHWRVGVLYDIGCQIHRSLVKWEFMEEWLPRLEFGVSIFHAYGHQWVCQLWYHPCKRALWGLSDGEGCERFWSELRRLIPGLRVTSYHRRLFIIDLQVEHVDEIKQLGAGKWLQDRVRRARDHLQEAQKKLGKHDVTYLLEQFR